jgi:hypothetical protein
MNKQITARLAAAIILVAMSVLGLRAVAVQIGGAADAAPPAYHAQAEVRRVALSPGNLDAAGQVVTQTFRLHAGWNTIYLEVEPINPSPLKNEGTAEDPVWVHEKSTIEAVFDTLNCTTPCLESVWTWNVPLSRMDYIVDPAEGLWDKPGWKRYFPQTSLGPDGVSRAFLTDLLSLHANTGYLVKLKDDVGDVQLQVSGTPVVQNHRWVKGSYNLAGFPIDPDAAPAAPTVGTFFQDLQGGPSPITEVRALGNDGRWGSPLAAGDVLHHGQAYLVYYDDQDPNAPADYTAPLNIVDSIGDGLQFSRRLGGGQQSVQIENLSSVTATITVTLVGGADAAVALRMTEPVSPTVELKTNFAVEVTLGAGDAEVLTFEVLSTQQPVDGEALLQISSDLGTRWLIPVSAKSGSLAGLWVGEVVVNNVSEGRLGATNVQSGTLTIDLRSWDESGIRGAAGLTEKISGNTASVAMTVTLALPEPEKLVVPQVISGTAPYVGGYVFEDLNQNGQPDASDGAFQGVTVQLTSDRVTTSTVTAEDGHYLFEGLNPYTYTLTLAPPPAGYTAEFTVTEPVTMTLPLTTPLTTRANTWPVTVTVGADGVTRIAYNDGSVDNDFPRYDAMDNRVEPLLNFGYVRAFDASLWTGACADRRGVGPQGQNPVRDLGKVKNGLLATKVISASLNPVNDVGLQLLGGSSQYVIYVKEPGEAGQGIACGEIAVGSPTKFADGRGSEFRYRLLLRVGEDGRTALLPYYEVKDGPRVSSAAFSIQKPVTRTGTVTFGEMSKLLDFWITIDPQDPLNPYKHKYHPDHDNLDAKFNEINFDKVDPYLWEAPEVRRHIQLELTNVPPLPGGDALAAQMDWGGATWGGLYKEVIKGIHKNDITVKGYFVIQQVLTADELEPQSYDN